MPSGISSAHSHTSEKYSSGANQESQREIFLPLKLKIGSQYHKQILEECS